LYKFFIGLICLICRGEDKGSDRNFIDVGGECPALWASVGRGAKVVATTGTKALGQTVALSEVSKETQERNEWPTIDNYYAQQTYCEDVYVGNNKTSGLGKIHRDVAEMSTVFTISDRHDYMFQPNAKKVVR
jgi:hypothetical protein